MAQIRRGGSRLLLSPSWTFFTLERKVRVNLLDFDARRSRRYVESIGEKPFRASQLLRWIHQRGVASFDQMTDLAKVLARQN